jgi:hypothetical protein
MDRNYSLDDIVGGEKILNFNQTEFSVNYGSVLNPQRDESLKNVFLRKVIAKDFHGLVKELGSILSGVQKRTYVNMRDRQGRTCLFFAVYRQDYEMCEVLLRAGAETKLCDHLGRTA